MLRFIFAGAAVLALGVSAQAEPRSIPDPSLLVPTQQTYQCRDYNSLVRCTQSCRAQLDQCYNRAGTDGSMQNQCEDFQRQCVSTCFSYYCP